MIASEFKKNRFGGEEKRPEKKKCRKDEGWIVDIVSLKKIYKLYKATRFRFTGHR